LDGCLKKIDLRHLDPYQREPIQAASATEAGICFIAREKKDDIPDPKYHIAGKGRQYLDIFTP